MPRMKKVKSICELQMLAEENEDYAKLLRVAISNLGGCPSDIFSNIRWLQTKAMETGSEQGVIDEVNFLLE